MLFYNCSVFIYSTAAGLKCEINLFVIVIVIGFISVIINPPVSCRPQKAIPRRQPHRHLGMTTPALWGSHPLVTPYYCRLGDLLCMCVSLLFCCILCCLLFLVFPYFSSVFPLVLWNCWLGLLTCKTVSQITYTVLVETSNPAQSINEAARCLLWGGRYVCLLGSAADVWSPSSSWESSTSSDVIRRRTILFNPYVSSLQRLLRSLTGPYTSLSSDWFLHTPTNSIWPHLSYDLVRSKRQYCHNCSLVVVLCSFL